MTGRGRPLDGLRALQVYAGPRARRHLREHGLRPEDIAVVPAAAGGPKALLLLPLDGYLFGHWLPQAPGPVHLLGASIGAWRMAAACLPDPASAFARLADDYVAQDYPHAPGRLPAPRDVSRVFLDTLQRHFEGQVDAVLGHPRHRLHVFTSRGRHLLGRAGRQGSRLGTSVGYLGAWMSNLVHRRAAGAWLERVVFDDPRTPLPVPLHDYPGRRFPLTAQNFHAAVLASCSIPLWLDAVHDIPGAPPGTYWDGGLTDYHLHLRYAEMPPREGGAPLVLYPHFQRAVVPGWLDKPLHRRHRATAALDNVVVLAPRPEWLATLPGGQGPDRQDFVRWLDDTPARIAAWRRSVAEAERLRDDFAALVARGGPIEAAPL